MSNSGLRGGYFWCLTHDRVENEENACAARHLLGPYPTAGQAGRALATAAQRTTVWDAEDARWTGEEA